MSASPNPQSRMTIPLREFRLEDASAVREVALAAFAELSHHYNDWPTLSRNISDVTALAASGEMILATVQDEVAGAVTYVGPGKKKRDYFPIEWPILRMLIVAPAHRLGFKHRREAPGIFGVPYGIYVKELESR